MSRLIEAQDTFGLGQRVRTSGAGSAIKEPVAVERPVSIATVFERLRQLREQPVQRSPWAEFARADWPRLFELLDVGVQLDAIRWSGSLARLGATEWPLLQEIELQGGLLEFLRETPSVSPAAEPLVVWGGDSSAEAAASLRHEGVAAIDFLFDEAGQAELRRLFALERDRQAGDFRRELTAATDAGWFDVVRRSLERDVVAELLGGVGRVTSVELTVSSQALLPQGIGWHRDLYWPQADNCASMRVTLDENSLTAGGEFLAWLPTGNRQLVHARRPFEATLLRNGTPRRERLYHAVAGYSQPGLRREVFVVQAV
ncbi:MAG: hypothetical protein ACKOJF_10895, partial [Planctomycetaceae bacterium]